MGMFLTKKAIPRRTFLRSAQAALGLPLLDAMIPAATAWAQTPAKTVKDQITVITNLRLQNASPGTHDTSNSAFLSAASAKHTESSDYFSGTTTDQIAAQQLRRETQLASLQLAMD